MDEALALPTAIRSVSFARSPTFTPYIRRFVMPRRVERAAFTNETNKNESLNLYRSHFNGLSWGEK